MKIKLNLLSTARREVIEESRKMRLVFRWGTGAVLILVIFFFLLFNVNHILKSNSGLTSKDYLKKELDLKYAEMDKYNSEIKKFNSKLSNIQNIQKEQIYWSKLFNKFNGIFNPSITLTNFSNDGFTIYIVGKANTRDDLVSLKDNLEKEECFQDVKLPLSNLVSRDNVDFQIEFSIKEECLKEK